MTKGWRVYSLKFEIVLRTETLQLTRHDLNIAAFQFAPLVDVALDDGAEPAPADDLVRHLEEVSRNGERPSS